MSSPGQLGRRLNGIRLIPNDTPTPGGRVQSMTAKRDPSSAEIDQWLDAIEPNPSDARDSTHIRRIIAAAKAVDASQAELRAAVAAARSAGDTWDLIGVALGISRQAAYQRFGKEVVAASPPPLPGMMGAAEARAVERP